MRKIPSWDQYFLTITKVVADRSSCIRRQVGALAVKDKRILCTGYNGISTGLESCVERNECLRDKLNIPSGKQHEICRAIHAEENLLIHAALHGINLKGCTIYCTHQPCNMCLRKIISLKPERLLYIDSYPDSDAIELLKEVAVFGPDPDTDASIFPDIYHWRFCIYENLSMRNLTLHEKITIKGILISAGYKGKEMVKLTTRSAIHYWSMKFGYLSINNYAKIG